MADTIRTQAQSLGLLVVGAVAGVSVQDLRDIVYSLFSKAYFTTGVTLPALADTAVPTPAAGNVTHYYSTTQSGLAFKDSSGVVHKVTST